jgi:hypothetical protein
MIADFLVRLRAIVDARLIQARRLTKERLSPGSAGTGVRRARPTPARNRRRDFGGSSPR